MANHTTSTLLVFERCFMDADDDATAALKRGDMQAHFEAAREYHTFAQAILNMTGVDPRPKE